MSKIAESELVINEDGSIFHLKIKPEELADTVILVGDPGRVDMITEFFESIEFKKSSREFVCSTGYYNGKRISAISTGIGTDNVDIVMTELDALANIDFRTREVKKDLKRLTILRLGTTGGLQSDVPVGSYVMAAISLGFDGLMNWYADREKIVDEEMERAFLDHVNWERHIGIPYFVKSSQKLLNLFREETIQGITISSPGFYGPQGRVVRIPGSMPDMLEELRSFRYDGMKITNFEMESSAIAGLAAHLGHEASTICYVIVNRYSHTTNTDYKGGMKALIKLALDKLSSKEDE